VAVSDQEPPALRARILRGLVRYQRQSATRALATIGQQDSIPPAVLDVWRDYLRDAGHGRRVGEFRNLAEDESPAVRELGYAVLLALESSPTTPAKAKGESERAIETAWKGPRATASLLRAIGRTDAVKYAFHIRNRLNDDHREVREAAALAAERLDLNRETGGTDRGPIIASIPFESVLDGARTQPGDPKLGERLFQRQGCVACHTAAPAEAPKGPSLVGIADRYKRAELTESILKPSAKIAQGFEPQRIATADGRTYEGFVVRELGNEVELRDARGIVNVVAKKDIDARGTGQISIMPTGLVDGLTIHDFACLLAFLE
jgi:putative heme-binding domain-containing protein